MNNLIFFIRVLWLLITSLLITDAMSQAGSQHIINHQLNVTYNKTSSLVFNADITHVDRGSRDVLVQRTTGVENVLKVKAARRAKFPETNVTVITSDGILHSFKVNYTDILDNTTVDVDGNKTFSALSLPVHFSTQLTSASMDVATKSILEQKPFFKASDKSSSMKLVLKGIFIHDKIMFFRLELKNKSQIRYDIANLRWMVKDKKQIKRTAIQEVVLKPLFIYGLDTVVVKGHASREVIFAFDKFTIPDAKKLIIELMEEKGGRHLTLFIKNNTIIRAHPLALP